MVKIKSKTLAIIATKRVQNEQGDLCSFSLAHLYPSPCQLLTWGVCYYTQMQSSSVSSMVTIHTQAHIGMSALRQWHFHVVNKGVVVSSNRHRVVSIIVRSNGDWKVWVVEDIRVFVHPWSNHSGLWRTYDTGMVMLKFIPLLTFSPCTVFWLLRHSVL